MTSEQVPESVRIHRIPERGRYDRADVDAILDASVVCHLAGIDADGRPLVVIDALDQAMHEPNPEVRLRILKRMEPFMEAYPPYWYYVARTQQELGQLFAALNTYTRVVALGTSHFRKDDMLATALANKAGIQDYLRQPSATETAEKALTYSTDVWETNLICAQVLRHNHKYTAAEDAVLRNLDVQLETDKSRAFQETKHWAALALTPEEKMTVENPVEMEKLADALPVERAAKRWIVSSDPDEQVERIRPYVEMGFRHLVFHAPGPDQERFLRLYSKDVIPRLRKAFG